MLFTKKFKGYTNYFILLKCLNNNFYIFCTYLYKNKNKTCVKNLNILENVYSLANKNNNISP